MKKILVIMFLLVITISITNANDYQCVSDGYNSDTKHNLYSKGNFIMTDSNDTYKCENYWMQGNTLDSKGGNDKIYIGKNTGSKKLTINMGDGNDNFYHTFHDTQLNGTTINGGNGNDTVNIAGANKEDFEIIGDCKDTCTIKNKKSSYLFKNVTLTSIENLVFNGKKVINTNTNSNTKNNTNADTNNYPKIDLSSYKTIIPAYWWSHTLNNKLTELNSHSAIVIINPNNGDFSKTEDIFKEEIKDTQLKNNLASGYLHSGYGKRDLSTVKNVIDNRLKYYPNIDGFFIDEASNESSKLDYYTNIYNYIKSKNPNLVVVINPGTTPDAGYFYVADNIVVYESSCSNYSKHKIPTWLEKYSHKVSLLGYKCNQEQHDNLKKKYGNKYITYFTNTGNNGDQWSSLSKYAIQADGNSTNTNTDTNNNTVKTKTNNAENNNKIKEITYNKLDTKINSLLKKLKSNSTKVGYSKKIILLIGKINKIKAKYKNNEIILVLIDYIDQKIREEIGKINLKKTKNIDF